MKNLICCLCLTKNSPENPVEIMPDKRAKCTNGNRCLERRKAMGLVPRKENHAT